jgi:hypothetical protein
MIKGKETLPFIYIRFIFTSMLYIIYKLGVEDQNQYIL